MIDKNKFDISQVFNLYLTFGGDTARTSVAAQITQDEVRELAESEGWAAKVKDLATIKEGNSGDVVIALNRAVNYAQATRARMLVDMVISELIKKSPAELVDTLSAKKYDDEGKLAGSTFSARALTDLIKAGEIASLMSARALGDTAQERPEGAQSVKGSSIALLVQQAMTGAAMTGADPVKALRDATKPSP